MRWWWLCLACAAALVAGGEARANALRPVVDYGVEYAADSLISLYLGGGGLVAPSGRPATLTLFTGHDLDASNGHDAVGFKLRPFHKWDETRFIVMAAAGVGRWRDRGRLALQRESDSASLRGHVLVGAEVDVRGGHLGMFVGPEYFGEEAVDPRGAVLRRERRIGARLQVDWWSRPTPDTLLTINFAAGTAKRDLWTRGAYGWRLGASESPWGFAGPEIGFSAAPRLARFRAGLHWSEIAFIGLKLRFSGGVSQESGRKAGAYLTLGSYRSF